MEKQNCGVRWGCVGGCAMMSLELGFGVLAVSDGRTAPADHRIPASVLAMHEFR